MGYSVAIRARNPTLRKKMIAFMRENYLRWPDVIGKPQKDRGEPKDVSESSRLGLGDECELDYDHSKKAVGFDYASHCNGWESCFLFSTTRWMALKIGEKRSKFKNEGEKTKVFDEPHAYIVYDGHGRWPIIPVKNVKEALKLPKDRRWCATDEFGVYVGPEVNRILTSYCEDIFGTDGYKAMGKEWEKLGERPGDPADVPAWNEKHEAIKVKYMRPEIDRMLPKVRAEVRRLDKLWAAET